MRATSSLAVAFLLTAGLCWGQAEKDKDGKEVTKKSELELALEEALKNNPDLRVAVAKAAEAEAQLARARAQVVQKVVAASQAIDAAKANKAACEHRVANAKSPEDVAAARASVAQAKATLAAAESEMEYLTGKGKHAEKLSGYRRTLGEGRSWRYEEAMRAVEDLGVHQPKAEAKGPAAERIRKALERKVSVNLPNNPPTQLLDAIRKKLDGIHVQVSHKAPVWSEKGLNVTLTDVPLYTALQLLEDSLEGYRVVVRDYGLLIAPQDKLPPNAVTLAAFLQNKPAEAPAKKDEPAAKTFDFVTGKVTQANSSMVLVSIGSDAGLVKGDVLMLYRMDKNKPRYLGRVKVIEVNPKTAAAEVVGKLTEPAKSGDEAVSTIPSPR